jgi:uncharacterized membrane protein YhhN
MKTITRTLTAFYFLIGLIYILTGNCNSGFARHIIKGSIIPFLIIILLINLKDNLKGINLLMLAGLLFSWAGDVILDFAFVPGLACFLVAQTMYLTAFFLTPGENVIFRGKAYLIIPVLLAGTALIYVLYDDLGDMKLPVIVYAVVILTMLVSAINRLRKVNRLSYYLVLTGAILFVLSDSAIAIDRFTWNFNYSGPVIMSTYLAAQYLIVTGYIKGITNFNSGNE